MEDVFCIKCLGFDEILLNLKMNPLESLINYVDELEENTSIFDNDLYKEIEVLKCSKCKKEIDFNDYFVKKSKLDKFNLVLGKMIGGELSGFLEYCSNCDEIKETNYYRNLDSLPNLKGSSVEEFLREKNIREEEHIENIIPFLGCENCSTGYDKINNKVTSKEFDKSFRIYSSDEINNNLDVNELNYYAMDYDITFLNNEINNFREYLRENAMLGLNHPIGRKLYQFIKGMFDDKRYYLLENVSLYRGRTRNKGSKHFTAGDMWHPPLGVSSHGRFNLVGAQVLYLSDSLDSIPAEVNYIGFQELDIATIKIEKPLKILDLSTIYGEFGRILSISPTSNNVLKLEYLLTNYISECCKEVGYQGIKYNGVKRGEYKNYALLDYNIESDLIVAKVETFSVDIVYKIRNEPTINNSGKIKITS